MKLFVSIINQCIGWLKTSVIEIDGFEFTLWHIALVTIILGTGGYIVGVVLREKE